MKTTSKMALAFSTLVTVGVGYTILQTSGGETPAPVDPGMYGLDPSAMRSAVAADEVLERHSEIILRGATIAEMKRFCVRPDGAVMVLDRSDLKVFDASGRHRRTIGRHGTGAGEFLRPDDIAVDDASGMYVLDWKTQRVTTFDREGTYRQSLPVAGVFDQLLVSGPRAYVYGPLRMKEATMGACINVVDGRTEFSFVPPTDFLASLAKAGFLDPMGFAGGLKSSGGRLYLVHPYEYRVRVFSTAGEELHSFAGSSERFVPIDPSRGFRVEEPPTTYLTGLVRVVEALNGIVLVGFRDTKLGRDFLDLYTERGDRLNAHSLECSGVVGACDLASLRSVGGGRLLLYRRPRTSTTEAVASSTDDHPAIVEFRWRDVRPLTPSRP